MARVVEFCGLPGSGKSTISAELRNELAIATLEPRPRSLRRKGATLWRHRCFVRAGVRALQASGRSKSERRQAFRYLVHGLERFDAAVADESQPVHVLDEVVTQRLFLLLVDGDGVHGEHLDRLLQHMPKCDLVVHVRIERAELWRRLALRTRALPERLAAVQDKDQLLDQAENLFEARARAIANDPDIAMVQLRHDEDINHIRSAVRHLIDL